MTRMAASGSAISKDTPWKYLYLKQILGIQDKISVTTKMVLYNYTIEHETNVNQEPEAQTYELHQVIYAGQ
jgi:hypothetical protein